MTDEQTDAVRDHLSDRAVQYAAEHIGEDIQMAAIVMPPVPRKLVEDVVDDYGGDADLKSHLYDLTDLSLAVNHAGDPMLDHSIGDEEPYTVTQETVAEIKVARGALISSFNRELAALAEKLGIDSDQDDLVAEIRDELGYEVDVSIDEEWVECGE